MCDFLVRIITDFQEFMILTKTVLLAEYERLELCVFGEQWRKTSDYYRKTKS